MRVGRTRAFRVVFLALATCAVAAARSRDALADPPPPAPAPPAPPTFPAPQPCKGPPCAPPAAGQPPSPPPPRVIESTTPSSEEGSRLRRSDGTEIYFYRTNFVSPGELIQAVSTLVSIPDLLLKDIPRSNQVAMQGPPEAIDTGLEVFAYFDVADPQVFVEAKIVELTYDSNFEFGFSSILNRDVQGPNTVWRGGFANLSPPTFLQAQQPGASPFQGAGLAFGFVGKLAEQYGAFDLQLQALQRDGTAEVLSRPSIVAMQGRKATVTTSQNIPVLQLTTSTRVTTPGQPPPGVDTVNYQSTPNTTRVGMDMLPTFIGDGYVTMWVKPTVSDITGFSQGPGGTSAPITSVREAETTVTMADGDTLIIGGLYTSTTISDKAKLPFLSDIPCLGKLFTRVKDQKVKTELVFFITPHILRKKSDYKVIVPPGEAERLRGACDIPSPGTGDSSR